MRIGIIGAGALGGTFAALLDRAGYDVAVTARGGHLAAIRADGLRLEGGYGSHLARVRAEETLPGTPDLALLAVKAQDAPAAAAQNAHRLHGVPVVVVQNGLTGPQAVREALPGSPLIGALSLIAATYLEPGVVTVTVPGVTVLAPASAAAEAVDVLGAVVDVVVADDLAGAQWSKLLINQLNALPAITGLALQEAIRSPGLVRAAALAMRETVRVAHASSVRLTGLPAVSPALVRALDLLPVPVLTAVLRRRFVAAMGDVPNPGSTLQSIRRGRPTEIDHLSGAVVTEGARRGVATPVNRAIVAAVHEVEASGRFLSPEEATGFLLSRRPRTRGADARGR